MSGQFSNSEMQIASKRGENVLYNEPSEMQIWSSIGILPHPVRTEVAASSALDADIGNFTAAGGSKN